MHMKEKEERVTNAIHDAINAEAIETGRHPKVIYMHEEDITRLMFELYPPYLGESVCPNCGHALIKYMGAEVRTIKPGTIVLTC